MKSIGKITFLFLIIGMLHPSNKAFSQDPNVYVYLCFGQSNMEGQATIEAQDKTGVDARFQVMEAVPCTALGRTQGSLSTAVPPLCRCTTGLCPSDYFGRTMVANLPTTIKVVIINVSVAGCKIELFDKVNYASYASTVAAWMTTIINDYGGNPYGRLVEIAKLAQKVGVIKGILLHQGESNTGDGTWPTKVKGIYNNLITDLGLDATKTPLLVGELRYQDQGGSCYSHNSIIATVPSVIPNSYVISASGIPGTTADTYHFTAAGYRTLGIRYAQQMLALMEPYVSITSPVTNASFTSPASITINATVANPNPNGTITKVDFYNGTTKIGTSTSSPYSFTWTNVASGTYSITAVATNSNNKVGTSSAVTVVVNGSTVPPTVTTPLTYCQNATAIALTATGTALKWYTIATGGIASTTAPIPSTSTVGSTTYYVSQTVGSTESSRAAITVNISALPVLPTVTTPINYVQGATASALTATGTALKWFTVSTGGSALSAAPIPLTATVGTTTYYVSQTANTCESSRAAIAVNVSASATKISLKSGWNYIGCPLTGSTAVASALSSIWSNVLIVKNLDVFYATANAPALNTLSNVQWGQGYFVKVSNACDLDWIAR
jgi:hypothetical protein